MEKLNSAHRRPQAKCQLVQTGYINELNFSCFCHITNILLTELSGSVWENLDRGQGSPIQTDLARLIRCLLYGENKNNLIRLM